MVLERSHATSVIDVLDHVLDKGIVIDAWLNLSVVGIDLITVEARVVVASFATYLKHSQALARAPLLSGAVFETAKSPRRSKSEARIR
jgi:hypothetical protein